MGRTRHGHRFEATMEIKTLKAVWDPGTEHTHQWKNWWIWVSSVLWLMILNHTDS